MNLTYNELNQEEFIDDKFAARLIYWRYIYCNELTKNQRIDLSQKYFFFLIECLCRISSNLSTIITLLKSFMR